MKEEIWKEILNFPMYQVSNLGQVKRLPGYKSPKGRILKLHITGRGYAQVNLTDKEKILSAQVHNLVAQEFIGPRPTPNHEINHKNGVKTNNCEQNLEWVTHSENSIHAIITGLKIPAKGEKIGASKLTEKEILEIRSVPYYWGVQTALAKKYPVSRMQISNIRNNLSWKHL